MAYTDKFQRTGTNITSVEIPEKRVEEIMKEVVQDSVALRLGKVHQMSSVTERYPLLSGFAQAAWQNGANQAEKDSAKKQTTNVSYDSVTLTTDELAVMIVVPDAWMDDSKIGWDDLQDELRRAFSLAIDKAIFFGTSDYGSLPSTFGDGVIPEAIAAGNEFVNRGSTVADNDDTYGSFLAMGKALRKQGYTINSYAAAPGLSYDLQEARDGFGRPLFTPELQAGLGASVLGNRFEEVMNGSWDEDIALVLGGEWDKLNIGVRQGMTFKVSSEATIYNDDGTVAYSAFQQDGKILRAVMRLGYKVLTPKKVLGGEYPFAVITPDPNDT